MRHTLPSPLRGGLGCGWLRVQEGWLETPSCRWRLCVIRLVGTFIITEFKPLTQSVFEKAFLDYGQRLIKVAEAAMVMRVSATSVSCS